MSSFLVEQETQTKTKWCEKCQTYPTRYDNEVCPHCGTKFKEFDGCGTDQEAIWRLIEDE